MKILKIENSRGLFLKESNQWEEIDKIDKEALLALLDIAISNDFEIDEYNTDSLKNKAHQIIYKHLSQKFNELSDNKNRFKDESEQLYKIAIDKYTESISKEDK